MICFLYSKPILQVIKTCCVSRPKFEQAFFPSIYEEQHGKHKFVQQSPYCKFNSPVLQLFPSSLYLAGETCRLDSVERWPTHRLHELEDSKSRLTRNHSFIRA